MFLSKINEYKLAQWATRTYIDAKANHVWFKAASEKAEQLGAPIVAALPKLPGAKAIDSAAAQTVTRAEELAAKASSQLARRTDLALSAAEKFGESHALASWAVRTPLHASDVVVSSVLPEVNAAVTRPAPTAEVQTLLQVLDKHIDLSHSLHARLAGKTFKGVAQEAVRGTFNSAGLVAKWAVDKLPEEIQHAIRDEHKDGLLAYAFRLSFAITKFAAVTVPLRAWDLFRSESHRVTTDVSARAAHEMQELGTRSVKAADYARETIHRRLLATAAAVGRTGAEPESVGEVKKAESAAAHPEHSE